MMQMYVGYVNLTESAAEAESLVMVSIGRRETPRYAETGAGMEDAAKELVRRDVGEGYGEPVVTMKMRSQTGKITCYWVEVSVSATHWLGQHVRPLYGVVKIGAKTPLNLKEMVADAKKQSRQGRP